MTQSSISQALMHTPPPEDLVKMQILTQKVWSWVCDFVFSTCSQMTMPIVGGLYSEQQGASVSVRRILISNHLGVSKICDQMYNKHHDQLKKLTGEGKLAEITKLNKMLSSFKKIQILHPLLFQLNFLVSIYLPTLLTYLLTYLRSLKYIKSKSQNDK